MAAGIDDSIKRKRLRVSLKKQLRTIRRGLATPSEPAFVFVPKRCKAVLHIFTHLGYTIVYGITSHAAIFRPPGRGGASICQTAHEFLLTPVEHMV